MKNSISILALLLFPIFLFSQSSYAEAIQQGDRALRNGNYKTAINKYFAAEAFDPSKKDEVKKKVNIVFEKIESLRVEAEKAKEKAQRSEAKATKALNDLQKTAQKTVELLLVQIDEHIMGVEYGKAKEKCEIAFVFDEKNETVKERMLELAFFYTETSDHETAGELLKNMGFLKNINAPYNRSILNKEIKKAAPDLYGYLLGKYYPNMVEIEGGEFMMGGENFDEKPIHPVFVSDYSMSATEVTVFQFHLFVHAEKIETEPPLWGWVGNFPMTMSWFEAVDYANWLSGMAGLNPAYNIAKKENEYGRIGYTVKPIWGTDGFRLPTEAEWEYAAQNNPEEQQYRGEELSPGAVSRLGPGALGLSDMNTSLWEWCQDFYARYEANQATINDPKGPETGDDRVIRGGAWNTHWFMQTPTYRKGEYASRKNDVGARLVRSRIVSSEKNDLTDNNSNDDFKPEFVGQPKNPAAEITVKNSAEFLNAIGSDRVIKLDMEEMILSDIPKGSKGTHYYMKSEVDGYELVIAGVKNMTIEGIKSEPVKLTTRPVYGDVLVFEYCEGITLKKINAGHGPEKGGCTGGVLNISNSKNIKIEDSILYGSGMEGINAHRVDNLTMNNSVIHGCTYHIMTLYICENFKFTNCHFYENEEFNLIKISESLGVLFDNCVIENNKGSSYGGSALFSVYDSKNVEVKKCTIKENQLNGGLTNDEELIVFTDNNMVGNEFIDFHKYEDNARDLMRGGNYSEAIKEYKKFLEYEPRNGIALNNMASCYYGLGNHQEAYDLTKKVTQINNRFIKNWYHLSWYSLFVGQPKDAVNAARKTMEINPDAIAAETNLALGLLLDNSWPDAEKIYKNRKGQQFLDEDELWDEVFLDDIATLEKAGISHPDFAKVKEMFKP